MGRLPAVGIQRLCPLGQSPTSMELPVVLQRTVWGCLISTYPNSARRDVQAEGANRRIDLVNARQNDSVERLGRCQPFIYKLDRRFMDFSLYRVAGFVGSALAVVCLGGHGSATCGAACRWRDEAQQRFGGRNSG